MLVAAGSVLFGVPRTSLVSNKASGPVGWDVEPRVGVLLEADFQGVLGVNGWCLTLSL